MKKIVIVVIGFLVSLFVYHFFIWGHYKNGYYITQPNRTILQKEGNKNIFISDILNIKNDGRYLLILRMPETFYSCPNGDSVNCKAGLYFMIVDMQNDKIYETKDILRFHTKLKEFGIKRDFTSSDIDKAQRKILKSKHICDTTNNESGCKQNYLNEILSY